VKIPSAVNGRPVTSRGVHLHPGQFHTFWCYKEETRNYWLDLLVEMGMSWVVMLTSGDSCLELMDNKVSAYENLILKGIIPIVRDCVKLPRHFMNMSTVNRMAEIADRHGVPAIFKLWNEPRDDREWVSGTAPDDWYEIFIDRWNHAAPIVLENGGYPGFPDGPEYDFVKEHPFRDTAAYLWEDDLAWFGCHPYGKGRPLNYPYDEVSQEGVPLTIPELNAALDDYAEDPAWVDPPLWMMNRQRKDWVHPGKTILDDATCWWSWKKVDYYARETFGKSVPLAVVEGGFVPRDRAGTGLNTDYRWPHTTPKMVGKKTLAMFEEDTPLFAICPWLLADEDLGHGGWPFDAWHGWAYSDKYGRRKPVIQTLIDNPPNTGNGGTSPCGEISAAQAELQKVLDALNRCHQ
jgi:hypothetical protein